MNLQVKLPVGTTPAKCLVCSGLFNVRVLQEHMGSLPSSYRHRIRQAARSAAKQTSQPKRTYNDFMRVEVPVRGERLILQVSNTLPRGCASLPHVRSYRLCIPTVLRMPGTVAAA